MPNRDFSPPRLTGPGRPAFAVLGGVLLAVLALLGAPTHAAPPAASPGQNTLRVGADIELLATETSSFLVPIYLRHGNGSSTVHIGLDYDELMLRFTESWYPQPIVQRGAVMNHDQREGHIDLVIPFDAAAGGGDEELLLELEFILNLPESTGAYGYRQTSQIAIDDDETYFLKADDHVLLPDATVDGGVIVYFTDVLELGSVRLTPDRQVFKVPVYVTHLQPQNVVFLMGLDYDELFLDLIRVEPVSPLVLGKQLRFDQKNGTRQKAWVEVPFKDGTYPRLLRHHLLDLVFEYEPEAGIPPNALLQVVPIPGSAINGEGGSARTEIREGNLFILAPEFIRGDANGSGTVDMVDALAILGYSLFSELREDVCLDALDADSNGGVEVSDAILLLNYLFLGGTPPGLPFPDPGISPPGVPLLGCPAEKPHAETVPLNRKL